MSNTKISTLTSATTPLAGTEVLPIVQSGATVKVANNDLRPKQIQSNATSGVLQVAGPAAATTRVMITPDANFTAARIDAAQSFTGDQTLSTGNLVQGTAAKGINFTANTPAAGMTSQLLNWYEEGTWTPAMVAGTSGTITTGSVGGKYTRVGRQVTATGYIDAASVSAPIGALTITGLPFACGSGLGSRTAAAIYPSGLSATAVTSVIGRVISGESQIRVDKYSAGTISNMAGDVIASTSFHFSVTYFV